MRLWREKKKKLFFSCSYCKKMQKKARILRPTLREKQRYIVYNANYFGDKSINYPDFRNSVNNRVLNFLGELSYGEAGVMFAKGSSKKGIIKVNREHIDHVKVGLMTLKKINNQDVSLRCIKVTGSIKKAEEALQK